MGNISRVTKAGKDGQVVEGLKSGVLKIDQLPLGGRIYTQAQAAALIQKRIAAANAVEKAKAEWLAAIQEYEAIDEVVDVVVRDLRNVVIGAFGEKGPELSKFQFVPRKRPVFTQEQIQAAVLKRNETRKARRTMGPKQKKAVKGVVPAEASAPAGGGEGAAAAVTTTEEAAAASPGPGGAGASG